MNTIAIKTWGNSAGVRLPVSLLKALGVSIGDTLLAEVENGTLTLRKGNNRPQYKLDDLLSEMPQNINTLPSWDAMSDVGNERIE